MVSIVVSKTADEGSNPSGPAKCQHVFTVYIKKFPDRWEFWCEACNTLLNTKNF